MSSFAYGNPETLAPHLPLGSRLLWDDVPELHLWGESPDFALHTASHPLGRVATIGACFVDNEAYTRTATEALQNDTPELLTSFPGNYATIFITPNGTKILKDVAGIAPVYYSPSDEQTVISSQPSLAAKGKLQLLPEHLAAHLALHSWDGGIDNGETCFDGVSRLGGGQLLEITDKGTVVSTYEPLDPDPSLTLAQGAQRLREALRESVRARIASGIKVKSNLSGGKDSSAIVALTLEQLGADDPLEVCFMDDPDLSGGDRDFVEAYTNIESRLKLTRINSHETTIASEPETIKQPEDLALAVSPHRFQVIRDIYKPSKDVGPTLHMSGNGGDEIASVGSSHLPDLFMGGHLVRVAKEGMVRARIRNVSPVKIWLDVASVAVRSGRRLLHKSAKKVMENADFEPFTAPSSGLNPASVNTAATSFLTPFAREGLSRLLLARADQIDTKVPTFGHYIVRNQVRASAIGQAIEAYCVEQDSPISVQAPLLDNNVIRAALAVEARRKGDPYNFKLILQEALRGILPEPMLSRNTKGVYDRHNARLYTETLGALGGLMDDSRLAKLGIISPDVVRSMLPSLAALPSATVWALERVMKTELWLRSLERSGLITPDHTYKATPADQGKTAVAPTSSLEGSFTLPEYIHAVASAKGTLTLYSRKTNKYYPLDAVQSHILRAFAAKGTAGAVVDELAERYKKAERAVLDSDVRRTLSSFAALGIIAPSDKFVARGLPQIAQKIRFTSGESKAAQSTDESRPGLRQRILANVALLGAVTVSRIAPGRRLDVLKKLQANIGGKSATYGEAQEMLKATQSIGYLGRLACMEASYAAALGLTMQRRHVDWHMGASFYPAVYHSWIEANGSPVRTSIEGEVSGDFQSFFTT